MNSRTQASSGKARSAPEFSKGRDVSRIEAPALLHALIHSRCVLRGYEIERGHHSLPSPRSERWPDPTYPTPPRDGRGPHGALLPHRRCLHPSQPPRPPLRIPQAPLGLRSHRSRPLPAAAGSGKRTLFLARRPEVLLPLVPRRGGAAPFLVPSALEEAQALLGTPAPRCPPRDGRGPGDAARRLYFAFGFAPQAGPPGLGFLGGGVG